MFNIFRDEGEMMVKSTQVHELFRRVKHPQLQYTVKDLEVRANIDGITYLEAANHLTAAKVKIPEYQLSQKVSAIHASGGNSGGVTLYKGGRNSGHPHIYV